MVGNDRDTHGCIGSAGYSWCEAKSKCLRPWEEKCETAAAIPEQVKILVSTADSLKFCNGADMDSAGYRKTITKAVKITLVPAPKTEAELAKAVAIEATTGQCQNALKGLDFTVTDGTVHIPPIDGWTGISIALCRCQPEVEVNLLQLPGINKVTWGN